MGTHIGANFKNSCFFSARWTSRRFLLTFPSVLLLRTASAIDLRCDLPCLSISSFAWTQSWNPVTNLLSLSCDKSLKWTQNGSLYFLNNIAKSYEEPLPTRNVCADKWNSAMTVSVTLRISTADFLKADVEFWRSFLLIWSQNSRRDSVIFGHNPMSGEYAFSVLISRNAPGTSSSVRTWTSILFCGVAPRSISPQPIWFS